MSNEKTYAAANPQAAFIVPGPLDPARLRDRVYSDGVSAKIGFRMLRSAPAMDLGVVADAAGMSVRELVIEVEQLRGRGRCDQFAAEAVGAHNSVVGADQGFRAPYPPAGLWRLGGFLRTGASAGTGPRIGFAGR